MILFVAVALFCLLALASLAAMLALLVFALALPVMGAYAGYRRYVPGPPGSRRGTLYWRMWWWYGYHCGIYRLSWLEQHLRAL